MQTYHSNRFLHQNKILKNTAHIALSKELVSEKYNVLLEIEIFH